MNRNYIKEHIPLVSIGLFLFIFIALQMIKPSFLYNRNGSIREFGIGYKNKTIFPLWLMSLVLGILCYLAVMYYVTYPKLM